MAILSFRMTIKPHISREKCKVWLTLPCWRPGFNPWHFIVPLLSAELGAAPKHFQIWIIPTPLLQRERKKKMPNTEGGRDEKEILTKPEVTETENSLGPKAYPGSAQTQFAFLSNSRLITLSNQSGEGKQARW